jgi:hypothetical protein
MTAGELWDRLTAQGHVEGEMPAPDRPAAPWYVRAMLGIAGWIGALFLIAFVGAAYTFVMSSGGAAAVIGLICCAGAFALFRAFDGNALAEQFGLAVSLAGQVMLIVAISQYLQPDDPTMTGVRSALVRPEDASDRIVIESSVLGALLADTIAGPVPYRVTVYEFVVEPGLISGSAHGTAFSLPLFQRSETVLYVSLVK